MYKIFSNKCFIQTIIVLTPFCISVEGREKNDSVELKNCAINEKKVLKNSMPLTREEKLMAIDSQFYKELSRYEPCENSIASEAQNAGIDESDKIVEGGNFGALSNDKGSTLDGQTLSENRGLDGVKSQALDESGNPIFDFVRKSDFEFGMDPLQPPEQSNGSIGIGKKEDSLEGANNLAILKRQIKEKAENEIDPTVKKELLERYDSIK